MMGRRIKSDKLWLTATIVLLLGVTGCGPSNPLGRLAISGKVTFDGEPLDGGMIKFRPQQRDGVSSGTGITNGIYDIAAHQGLPPGTYTVRIFSTIEPEDAPLPDESQADDGMTPTGGLGRARAKERIPPKYNSATDLAIEVTEEGPNEFNFDLESK